MKKPLYAGVAALALAVSAPAFAQKAATTDNGPGQQAPLSVPATPPPAAPPAQEGIQGAGPTMTDGDQGQFGTATTDAMVADHSYGSYKNAKPGSFAGTIAGNYSADDLIGRTIVDSHDTSVGNVEDLLLGPKDSVENVLVDVGGFLGIGTKTVALDLKQIQLRDDASGDLQVALTKDQIEALPEVEETDGEWRTVAGTGHEPAS